MAGKNHRDIRRHRREYPIWRTGLRALREARRELLRQVAGDLGISVSHLSQIEMGQSEPSLALALRIARRFGSRVEDIWLERLEQP